MTRPSMTPSFLAGTVDAAASELRRRGLRLSASRRLVLQSLFAAARPVSAEEIARGLDGRFPSSDLTSVYRNLETLERHGLVRHAHLGHGPGQYLLATAADQEFLVCEVCGGATPVDPRRVDAARAAIRAEFGFEARFAHFPISGTCRTCISERPPEATSDRALPPHPGG